MQRFVALLRAVNVGGRKLAMADLRDLAVMLGWRDVATYIQSGNLLFAAEGEASGLERDLELAIRDRLGMDVSVMVRSGVEWSALLAANPLAEAAASAPSRLLLCVPKCPIALDAAAALQARARDGEIVRAGGGALWIHYADGVGRSKLSPALIDRLAGSPTTARNWNTAVKLRAMS